MSKQDWIFFGLIIVLLVFIGRTEQRFHESDLKFQQEIRNEN